MRLSVSIVTGRSGENMERCFRSISAALGSIDCTLSLVVTRNCTEWDVEELLKKYFPDAQVIRNEKQAGFGANHNAALIGREDDYALVLNDDIELASGSIEALLRFADAHPKGALFGPLLYPGSWEAGWIPAGGRLGERLPKPLLTSVSLFCRSLFGNGAIRKFLVRRSAGLPPQDEKRAYASGACCLVRRSYIRENGLYDPEYYMYYDDIDLGHRARLAGWECWQVSDAKVMHLEGGSFSPRTWSWIMASTQRYAKKYHGLIVRAVAFFLISLAKLVLRLKGVKV